VRAPALAILALALLVAACSQSFDASSLGVPVSMAAPAGEAPQGKAFKVTTHSVHALFGLVTVQQANLRKGLATEMVGGDEITGLKIKSRSRFFDLLVTGLTLGLLVPKSVTYEGVVVGR
jgi:hypothetical protein